LRNFLLLFLHQICLHRIIIIVLADQLGQFDFFFNQWSIDIAGAFASLPPLSSTALLRILRVVLRIILQLLISHTLDLTIFLLIARVIDADHAAHHARSTEIVHSQIATSLVLILQETESATLARILVADQVDVDRVPILTKDCKNISFAKFER
jgi:hypothetical protein